MNIGDYVATRAYVVKSKPEEGLWEDTGVIVDINPEEAGHMRDKCLKNNWTICVETRPGVRSWFAVEEVTVLSKVRPAEFTSPEEVEVWLNSH